MKTIQDSGCTWDVQYKLTEKKAEGRDVNVFDKAPIRARTERRGRIHEEGDQQQSREHLYGDNTRTSRT